MSSFLLASLAVLFAYCSLDKGFAFQTRREALQRDLDPQYSHLVHLSSLLPSATCKSSTKGSKGKTSLEVVHRHGPCSQLNQDKAKKAPTPNDILSQDQERVNYIHSKLSKKFVDSATLPAKDGFVINGPGNYFVVVGLGTPKRDVALAFDTGSDLTWTQCKPCAASCYQQEGEIFDPSKSSSYSSIECTSSLCTQLSTATGYQPKCSNSTSSSCIYEIHYVDSSFSVGYFSGDRLTVTTTDAFDDFLFGCGQNNQGLFGGNAGLLGLGRHPISFVQQTATKYGKIFSYCIPSTPSNVGYLTFGDSEASNDIKYTPFSTIPNRPSLYGLDITAITVGGTQLPVSSNTFSAGGAFIDSGTAISRLPPTAYNALRAAFRQAMTKYPQTSAVTLLDTCYDLSGNEVVSIPKISFTFGGSVTVELAALGTIYVVDVQHVCLAFAANKDDRYSTIFGNVQQKTLQVVYDIGGGRLGFGVGGCK